MSPTLGVGPGGLEILEGQGGARFVERVGKGTRPGPGRPNLFPHWATTWKVPGTPDYNDSPGTSLSLFGVGPERGQNFHGYTAGGVYKRDET